MEQLLKHFRVGCEGFIVDDRLLEPEASLRLVRVVRPHEVHRDIRVDEDHSTSVA
jgi:hypothetical protein